MDDLEVRDLYAMFAMCGMVANRGLTSNADEYARIAYVIADQMLETRKPQTSGLPSIKRKPRK